MDIEAILGERQKTYGEYTDVAHRSQIIKAALRASRNWNMMASCQRESMEMFANKLARILEGDCNHLDSWTDLSGYSQLVVKYLERNLDD